MDDVTRKAMEAAGWRFGDAADFLGLTDEERQLVELRLSIARAIRQKREAANISQKEAAARIKTTQPRFARIEAGAPGVSLDQMVRGLFALGGSLTISGASSETRGRSVAKVPGGRHRGGISKRKAAGTPRKRVVTRDKG